MSHRLNQLLEEASSPSLSHQELTHFVAYLALLQKWNARTNLTAIRDDEGILSRHFLESILTARALPHNLSNLLDLGSGAGFPGLPIAILRPDMPVTLAESQHKKAAFLREATRTLKLNNVQVHAARAETLTPRFACATLRAVDKMDAAIGTALRLLKPNGFLALLTTVGGVPLLSKSIDPASKLSWNPPVSLSPNTDRVLQLIGTNPIKCKKSPLTAE